MSSPQPVQAPHRTHRGADYVLPVLASSAAAALCVYLLVPATEDRLARPPALFGGWLVGLLLPRLHPYRFRLLGLAPYAATVAAVLLLAVGGPPEDRPPWLVAVFGLFQGLAVGSVLRFRDRFRAEWRRFLVTAGVALVLVVGIVAAFRPADPDMHAAYRWGAAGLSVAAALLAWATLFRPAIEFTVELIAWPLYRLHGAGPGLKQFPIEGPVLVIANHAAWFDPLYVAKFVPRAVTPMMTASFYDLPVIRLLMTKVFHVIRVSEVAIRREAPEVQAAIAALDAGKCVVIFPEGYLRRKEDVLLKRFGQGVWQILKARPTTPVVASWVEGSWGSYFSHKGGPPTKGKRFDVWRRIGVALAAPETVPADVLAEHLPTRVYLMNKVLAAREHLGLPPAPPVELPNTDEEKSEDNSTG